MARYHLLSDDIGNALQITVNGAASKPFSHAD